MLIVLDTVRYDALSLSGQPADVSPRIARLARHGVSFSNAYSTWDETTGSHFSMLTGFATGLKSSLNDEAWSLVHQLEQRGYSTFGVAANLNLSQKSMAILRPFDEYVCLGDLWNELSPAAKSSLLPELDRRIAAFEGGFTDFNRLMMFSSGSRAIELFERQLDKSKSPFFGFINLIEPHDPYFPDPAQYDFAAEAKELSGAPVFHGDIRNRPIPPELTDPRQIKDRERRAEVEKTLQIVGGRAWSTSFDLGPAALATYRRRYAARVREADQHVGRIVDGLHRRGLMNSTIVIITSDHGESFGEKNLITHAFGNAGDRESTHRVPLLWIFPPGYRVKSGRIAVPTALNDIPPTIYDLTGIDWLPLANLVEIPGTFGKSLATFIDDPARRLATAPADMKPQPRSEAEKTNDQREAEARLRALGYIQ